MPVTSVINVMVVDDCPLVRVGIATVVNQQAVKTHLKSLFRKLDVSDRAEAVREGLRRGFIQSE